MNRSGISQFLRSNRGFGLLLVLFFGTRFLLLMTSIELISWPEELYRGTIAQEILSGLKRPLWDYQADSYDGGSLWAGCLTSVFFKIAGPTLFSLKLAPVFVSLLLLILIYLFLKTFFGYSAGWWGGLLFVFPPPGFLRVSFLNIGAQYESLLFLILGFLILYKIFEGNAPRWSGWCLGVIQGLGVWFTALNIVGFFTFLAALFLDSRVRRERSSWIRDSVLGFALGAMPFLGYNALYQFRGVRFLAEIFTLRTVTSWQDAAWARVLRLFFIDIRRSFYFMEVFFLTGPILEILYGIFVLLALGVFLREIKRKATRRHLYPFAIYFLFFTLIYAFAELRVDYRDQFYLSRYLLPLHFIFILILALPLTPRWIKGGVLILGILGQVPLYFTEKPAQAFHYKGYNYVDLGALWSEDSTLWGRDHNLAPLRDLFKKYDSAVERLLAYGFFYGPNPDGEKGFEKADIKSLLGQSSLATRPFIAAGYGSYHPERAGAGKILDGPLMTDYFDSGYYRDWEPGALDSLSGYPSWHYFNSGMRQGLHKFRGAISVQNLSDNEKLWFYRGVGAALTQNWLTAHTKNFLPPREFTAWALEPEEFHEAVAWGAGWTLRVNFLEDEVRFKNWMARVSPKILDPAEAGAKAFKSWFLYQDSPNPV